MISGIITNISFPIVVSLVIGIVIGIVLTKFTEIYECIKGLLKNKPIEFIVASISIVVFLIALLGSIFEWKIANNVLVQSLSFFASVVLAWILANFSNENSFKKKQEESAIRSYRHSIKLKTNIDYSIGVANIIYQDMIGMNCKFEKSCPVRESVLRLRDALITAQINAGGSINDWSDVFSDQLLKLDSIKIAQNDKRKLSEKMQEYDPYNMGEKVYLDDLNAKIKEQDNLIDGLKDGVESSILLTLIQDEKFREEHLDHIKKEQEYKQAMGLQKNINHSAFKSRADYRESDESDQQKADA